MRFWKKTSWAFLPILLMLVGAPGFGQSIPSPEKFFGHRMGAEKKLARWDKIVDYMQLVGKASDRVIVEEVGKSTNSNPFLLMVISSPANLRNIQRYKDINKKLFDPRTIKSDKEAESLIDEARIFVCVTCSMHATEVGATQMSVEMAHRLATEKSSYIQNILDNVVFLLVPCLNPDGQIMVTDWYNKTLGTPYEGSRMPWLYHPYVGHDNNRDAYMFTQKESQLIGKIVFQDWLPEVWLDEHQMGSSGARIFVMPAADPINPNVDPLIYRNTGLLGFAQAAALEKAGKEGIIYGRSYTYWWQGAMGWAGWWHNMLGMLTELASVRIATSTEQQKADPSRPQPVDSGASSRGRYDRSSRGPIPPPRDIQFRSQYPRPWLGGKWTLRDIVEYELIATFGLLEAAANLRSQLLEGLLVVGKRQVAMGKKGDPFAILVPKEQADQPTVIKLLQTMAYGGVEVHQSKKAFTADGISYPTGTYVILMAQPFRAYAKDLLEAQDYPKISPAPGVPARPPYDAAGWSLGMQMGVETIFVKKPFEADLAKLQQIVLPPGNISGTGSKYLLDHQPNNSLVAVNRLLKKGYEISWIKDEVMVNGKTYAPGAIVVGGSGLAETMKELSRSLGVDVVAADIPISDSIRIRSPKTALYQPWGGNMDEGWTRWLLEQNEFPFETIHPEDLRQGDSFETFDAIIFPDMRKEQILKGLTGETTPPEYRGGIEETGVEALRKYIGKGGTVITIGRSATLLMDEFAAPFRDSLQGVSREEFFCPGSIVRVLVDNTHPIAYGMPIQANAAFSNSLVLEPVPSFSTMSSSIVVRYPTGNILQSGWLHGESYLHNKVGVAEVKLGNGRMVMIPIKVQHRAQPYGTFKLLFNAILTSATE
ncbi:MAG: hypothetical protein JSV17_14685 [Candidatus Aminicenantes bacterium]|nr:MAG: hypothetical protein JSV17_14685 [Candidatus Aminicenantes bacterium]